MKYYNFNYKTKEYYEVPAPDHDHYTYDYKTDAWYEIILREYSSTVELSAVNRQVVGSNPTIPAK